MTHPTGGDVPSPRAATTPFGVPPRQATLTWSRDLAEGPPVPRADDRPRPADDRPRPAGQSTGEAGDRRGGTRWLVPALVAAVVSTGVVGTLTTVGPFTGSADDAAPGVNADKAPASRADTGWEPLEVSGGFIVTGDGARYRVVEGICYLQVHLRDPDGIWAANAPIAVLPPSARPAWNHAFVASRDGVPYSEVGVYDDGSVLMARPGDGFIGWLTLSASFPAGD